MLAEGSLLARHQPSRERRRKVSGGDGSEESVVSRLKADDSFQRAMTKSMHPGMVMIVTDNPLHPDRRSGQDFVIMSSA